MRENIYIRKGNEKLWQAIPKGERSALVNDLLEKGVEQVQIEGAKVMADINNFLDASGKSAYELIDKEARSIIEPIEQGSLGSPDALSKFGDGFGLKEPCPGHEHGKRWDCGRPGCKYGAGK